MSWVLDNLDLIWALSLDHLRQSLIAIVLGFLVALPIGWAAFRYTALRGPTLTTVGLLYTIPSLGLFAVLAAAFGIPLLSEANLIVALTIYAVAIMTRSVTDGLVSVDPVTRAAAVAVGFGSWRRFWTVDFPLAGPGAARRPPRDGVVDDRARHRRHPHRRREPRLPLHQRLAAPHHRGGPRRRGRGRRHRGDHRSAARRRRPRRSCRGIGDVRHAPSAPSGR